MISAGGRVFGPPIKEHWVWGLTFYTILLVESSALPVADKHGSSHSTFQICGRKPGFVRAGEMALNLPPIHSRVEMNQNASFNAFHIQ